MDKLRTCFFTGHRIISGDKLNIIKEKLEKYIENMIIEYDVKNFISGGALGFDTIAASAVVKMREKYPHIRLIMYLPCYKQELKWSDIQKYRYRMLLSKADEVLYVNEEYTDDCMRLRNLKMVKDSFFCIAFCIRYKSGTGMTLKNAKSAGHNIINIADEIYEN